MPKGELLFAYSTDFEGLGISIRTEIYRLPGSRAQVGADVLARASREDAISRVAKLGIPNGGAICRAGRPVQQPTRTPDVNPAANILARLGGAKKIAADLGIPRGTVHGWRRKGRIPLGRRSQLMGYGETKGVFVRAHEFGE